MSEVDNLCDLSYDYYEHKVKELVESKIKFVTVKKNNLVVVNSARKSEILFVFQSESDMVEIIFSYRILRYVVVISITDATNICILLLST